MRVGLASDFYYPWIAGPASLIRALARGLSSSGHDVSLLVPSPDGPGRLEMDGSIEITRAATVSVPMGYRLRVARSPKRTSAAWLDAFQPDVVHVHHPFPLSAATIYAARHCGIPVVATNHTIPACTLFGMQRFRPSYRLATACFGWWIVHLLERCDAVATPTETAAAELRSLGYRGEITSISNGVDTVRFSPGPANGALREKLGLDTGKVVLYTGRLDAEKQMDVWLRAVALVSRTADAQFVVGGEGAERPRLERLAIDLGLSDRLRFVGYVSEPELPDLYRLADVYFITSPVELQSISTLEAVASGLPVVACRARALTELVDHGRSGYLVDPNDHQDAGRALERILGDERLRREMSRRSCEISAAHDVATMVDSYVKLFQAAVSEKGDVQRERATVGG